MSDIRLECKMVESEDEAYALVREWVNDLGVKDALWVTLERPDRRLAKPIRNITYDKVCMTARTIGGYSKLTDDLEVSPDGLVILDGMEWQGQIADVVTGAGIVLRVNERACVRAIVRNGFRVRPRHVIKVRVVSIEGHEVFDTISEAARSVDVSRQALQKAMRKGNRAGGMHWAKVLSPRMGELDLADEPLVLNVEKGRLYADLAEASRDIEISQKKLREAIVHERRVCGSQWFYVSVGPHYLESIKMEHNPSSENCVIVTQ